MSSFMATPALTAGRVLQLPGMSYPTLIKNVGSTGLAPALQPYQVGGLDLSNSIKPFNGTTGGVSGASGTMSTISKMMPYLGAGLGVLSGVSTIINNSRINDVSAYEDLYKDYGNEEYTGDFNQLIQQRRNSYVENVPSWEQIRGMTAGDKAGSAIMSGAEGALAGLGFGPWGALAGGLFGLFASIFGSSLGDSAATKARNNLKRDREDALAKNQQQFLTGVHNAEQQVNYNALSNIAALGGPLHSYGTDWTNGITFIDNGGTHESNPLEGVPMGIADDGQPNLVEEGEVIFNDYVFSNRIPVPKAIKNKYKLRSTKNITFAEAAKKLQKESEERPNDPISKRGLNDAMNTLMQEQELLRQEENINQFAEGGKIHIKPSKKGTFTAAASRHNMRVQEFASKVLANPEDYSPAMRKKANFARNASKWKHDDGGHLNLNYLNPWNVETPVPNYEATFDIPNFYIPASIEPLTFTPTSLPTPKPLLTPTTIKPLPDVLNFATTTQPLTFTPKTLPTPKIKPVSVPFNLVTTTQPIQPTQHTQPVSPIENVKGAKSTKIAKAAIQKIIFIFFIKS